MGNMKLPFKFGFKIMKIDHMVASILNDWESYFVIIC